MKSLKIVHNFLLDREREVSKTCTLDPKRSKSIQFQDYSDVHIVAGTIHDFFFLFCTSSLNQNEVKILLKYLHFLRTVIWNVLINFQFAHSRDFMEQRYFETRNS